MQKLEKSRQEKLTKRVPPVFLHAELDFSQISSHTNWYTQSYGDFTDLVV